MYIVTCTVFIYIILYYIIYFRLVVYFVTCTVYIDCIVVHGHKQEGPWGGEGEGGEGEGGGMHGFGVALYALTS